MVHTCINMEQNLLGIGIRVVTLIVDFNSFFKGVSGAFWFLLK